jgi:hypothetical protein
MTTQQHPFPEWAVVHREAARCYSEKAAAYVRWASLRRVIHRARPEPGPGPAPSAPTPAGR